MRGRATGRWLHNEPNRVLAMIGDEDYDCVLGHGGPAVESGFLFDQSAHFRFAIAHRLRERAMPEPVGMLESGHRHDDDCGRPLHARLRILRRDNGETVRARRR